MKKTFICTVCRHKFTLDIKWMIEEITVKHHAKMCIPCQNKMVRKAVYGTDECTCLNCM